MKIFLIGYMACGKSTIGRKLSQRLGWKLYDTDKEIVSQCNKSVAEIFDTGGEEYFRRIERETIERLIAMPGDMIISTGGGVPTYADNMELINGAGVSVFIARSAENTIKRLSQFGRDKRPKLRGLNDEELLEYMTNGIIERQRYYSQATVRVDADRLSDDDIVCKVIQYLKLTNGQ